jgi:hypothetical protein
VTFCKDLAFFSLLILIDRKKRLANSACLDDKCYDLES